jgi:concanavalin A-like lectin/glucanase superfamily protein
MLSEIERDGNDGARTGGLAGVSMRRDRIAGVTRQPRSWAIVSLSFSSALTMLVAVACSHDWDGYDPRLGASSSSASSGGVGGATSVSASSSDSVASSTVGSGSAGGSSGVGGGDAGPDADAGPPTYRDTILADGPLAYWRFGDAQGPVISDEMVQHPGTASSKGLTYGVPGLLAGNTAMSFDGSSGTVDVAGGWDFLNKSPYSFEVWVKLGKPTNDYPRILSKEENNSPRQGYLILAGVAPDGGSPFFGSERWFNDDNILAAFYHGPVSGTDWTHVVARYDGVTGSMFVNGALTDTAGNAADPGIVAVANAFTIGATSGHGSHFSGSLDELAVYGKSLSDAEILAHYNAGLAGL